MVDVFLHCGFLTPAQGGRRQKQQKVEAEIAAERRSRRKKQKEEAEGRSRGKKQKEEAE